MMKLLLIAITVAATGHLAHAGDEPKHLHPVLLIPGTQGNRLEAKLNKTEVVRSFCKKQSDWFTIWFDVFQLLPGAVECWTDNFRLDYDKETGVPVSRPGVETRVPGFGDTYSVEYINPAKWVYGYMDKLVEALVQSGYERGTTVRAAPYDFRLAPNYNTQYLTDVKNLIEEMYSDAGNKSVAVVTHAAGSRIFYYFLTLQTPEWKAKYVARWITAAGSLGGDVVVLSTLSAGLYDGPRGLSRETVRTVFRSFSNLVFESPDPLVFKDEIIFQFRDLNYTAADLSEIYGTIGHEAGLKQLEGTRSLITNLDAPGVKVTCLYGSGIPTIEKIVYKDEKSLLNGAELIRGPGDGNVNLVSASACERWAKTEGFNSKLYLGIKHLDLIRDKRPVEDIVNAVNDVNGQE